MTTLEERKREDARGVWEAKCLCMDEPHILSRRNKAIKSLAAKGIEDPEFNVVERERFRLEDEEFESWFQQKLMTGFI